MNTRVACTASIKNAIRAKALPPVTMYTLRSLPVPQAGCQHPGHNNHETLLLQMLEAIVSSSHDFFEAPPGCACALLVNNLGSVTLAEVYIVARAALRWLQQHEVASQSQFLQGQQQPHSRAYFRALMELILVARTAHAVAAAASNGCLAFRHTRVLVNSGLGWWECTHASHA